MKKFILAICAGIIALGARAQEYPELGAKLEQYFAALAGEPVSVQNNECDFLIESCRDSLVRQYVALKIYDHYLRSKIMGDDAVAVHVADKWFLSGKVKMHSDEDLRNLVNSKGKVEAVCHYCNKKYTFTKSEIENFIESRKK